MRAGVPEHRIEESQKGVQHDVCMCCYFLVISGVARRERLRVVAVGWRTGAAGSSAGAVCGLACARKGAKRKGVVEKLAKGREKIQLKKDVLQRIVLSTKMQNDLQSGN